MQVKCQGFDIPRQTWQCNVKHDRLQGENRHGFTSLLSQQCGGYIAGKCLLCSGAGGGGGGGGAEGHDYK